MIWLNEDGWSDYKKLLIWIRKAVHPIREASDMYNQLLEGGWSNNLKQAIRMIFFLKSNDPASGN